MSLKDCIYDGTSDEEMIRSIVAFAQKYPEPLKQAVETFLDCSKLRFLIESVMEQVDEVPGKGVNSCATDVIMGLMSLLYEQVHMKPDIAWLSDSDRALLFSDDGEDLLKARIAAICGGILLAKRSKE